MALNPARILGRTARPLVALACAISLLSALGCGGGDDAAKSSADSGSEVKGSREVTLPGSDEEEGVRAVIATGELPAGYPDDIPIPDSAEPSRALVIPNQSGLVTFRSSSSREDVFSYYKNELPNQGWTVQSEEDGLRSLVRGTKGDRKVAVTISTGDEGTEFAVTFEGS